MPRARARWALAVLLLATAAWLGACEEPSVCGDGVVGTGESEETCCQDTGCSFGVCDEGSSACADPWLSACAESESCASEGPYQCRGDEPPAYSCASCGCPGDGRCEGGVCWSLDEIRARRVADEVATDLDLDAYFTLVDELERPPLTLTALSQEVADFVRTDRRHSALLFGLTTLSARERLIAAEVRRVLRERGLELPDDPLLFDDGSLSESACEEAEGAASEHLADEAVLAMEGFADAVHRETCFYEELWARCAPPTVDGCVLRGDRIPVTLIVVDFDAALERVDRALLIRASNRPAGERTFHLDASVTRWQESVLTWPAPSDFVVELSGEAIVARARLSERYEGTWWVSLPSRGKQPWGLLGYRLLWHDANSRSFMAEHDLVGRDCSWEHDATAGEVRYRCAKGGAEILALIDVATQALTEVVRAP